MILEPLPPYTPSIPLSSAEILWEWHIAADALYLSQGACRALDLPESCQITTRTAFISHIPAPCLPTLHELWESIINGASGSSLETTYPFDQLLVRERLLVLERNAEGRAVRMIGQGLVSHEQSAYLPSLTKNPGKDIQLGTAYWFCTFPDRTLHMDARCAALLGYQPAHPLTMPLDDWKARMHPEEGYEIACRHQLMLEESLFGDTLEDMVRIRRENGEYLRMGLQGAVLERDEHGRALKLGGSLYRAEVQAIDEEGSMAESGRLLFAINATGDGLWDWDARTDLVYFSPRYLSMLGYTAEEFPGCLDFWKMKVHPDDYHKIVPPQAKIVESMRYGDTFECTYRLMCADGSWKWILGRGYVTHRDESGRATRLVGLHTDITTSQGDREHLEDLVKNDPLTGLRSRNFCDIEIERLERDTIRPVSVISCDVCGLKLINDYLGHAIGDTLLSQAATLLRQALRATDCVARMGGDEFTVLLPTASYDEGKELLRQIEKCFAEHNQRDEMPIFVSFGLASAETLDITLARVLMTADKEMLRQKNAHRKDRQRLIKNWIEKKIDTVVSLEDSRCGE